jgi:AcrR family transcriptional regulator
MAGVKYESILKVARQLFWKHGFKRVSVEELCSAANVSKMTFYKFFPNKVELAKVVFTNESNDAIAKFKNILRGPGTPAEKIEKLVQLKVSGTNEISREFLIDFYAEGNDGLNDFVKNWSHQSWVKIVAEIRQAQKAGIISNKVKPELFLHLTQALAGLVTNQELLSHYDAPSNLIKELTYLIAFGMLPSKVS